MASLIPTPDHPKYPQAKSHGTSRAPESPTPELPRAMQFADRLARVNRSFTNKGMRLVSSRVPPLATVVHRGRRSGCGYRTPVLCFDTDSGVVIALTYGPDRDWVRNIEEAGGCTIEQSGRSRTLSGPRVLDAAHGLGLMPAWIRPFVSRWVHHYLTLEAATDTTTA